MKNLYIIGNGFDLHHRIKSGYCHYMDWLKIHHKDIYDNIVYIYGDKANDWKWWNNFESNLGYVPCLDEYAKDWGFRNQPTEEDFEHDHYVDENRGRWDVEAELGELINSILSTFHEWIANGLNEPDERAKVNLDTDDSFFVNFNYTETLEKLYGIENVFHIHGKIEKESEYEHFVLGHGRSLKDFEADVIYSGIPEYDGKMSPKDYMSMISVDPITENAQRATCEQMASLQKDVAGIIKENKDVFQKMTSVKNVYIYGLSFGDVDKDYLVETFKYVPDAAKITISYYGTNDKEEKEAIYKINRMMTSLGRNYQLIKLQDILAPLKNSLFE